MQYAKLGHIGEGFAAEANSGSHPQSSYLTPKERQKSIEIFCPICKERWLSTCRLCGTFVCQKKHSWDKFPDSTINTVYFYYDKVQRKMELGHDPTCLTHQKLESDPHFNHPNFAGPEPRLQQGPNPLANHAYLASVSNFLSGAVPRHFSTPPNLRYIPNTEIKHNEREEEALNKKERVSLEVEVTHDERKDKMPESQPEIEVMKKSDPEEDCNYKNWIEWHELNRSRQPMVGKNKFSKEDVSVKERWDELKKKFIGLTSAQALELEPNAIISSHPPYNMKLGINELNKLFLICKDEEAGIITSVNGYWVPYDFYPHTDYFMQYWSCSPDFDESKAPRRLLECIKDDRIH